jgi:hypothetical protein
MFVFIPKKTIFDKNRQIQMTYLYIWQKEIEGISLKIESKSKG